MLKPHRYFLTWFYLLSYTWFQCRSCDQYIFPSCASVLLLFYWRYLYLLKPNLGLLQKYPLTVLTNPLGARGGRGGGLAESSHVCCILIGAGVVLSAWTQLRGREEGRPHRPRLVPPGMCLSQSLWRSLDYSIEADGHNIFFGRFCRNLSTICMMVQNRIP
jgi:hypothetical protein